MKGLIVDVRSNPGGLVTSVVDILDQILPEERLFTRRINMGKRDIYIRCVLHSLSDGSFS